MKTNPNKYYYTGKPCRNGHVGARFVSSRASVECAQLRNQSESHRKATKKYYRKNADSMKDYAISWAKANPESIKQIQKTYAENNRAKCNAKVSKRYHAKLQRIPKWANLDKIALIYAEAQRLTEETGIEHHVDHIIPIQGKRVSGLHVESNLRVITKEENLRKGNRFV